MAELDPVKSEIFYQRMDKMLNEAKEVLRYLSTGLMTREAGEVQEAFYLPNGDAVHIACGIMMHIMNVTRVIRYMLANKYDASDIGIYEDDQFINNDAYIGGMHCQDMAVVKPLFWKGKHMGYVAAISHTTDVGGIESGGTCPSARESTHDGIHLVALKLVDQGKLRRDTFGTILRAVRDSTYVELDIRARMAANDRATRRLMELVEEVGPEFFTQACKRLVDDAEKFARDRIKTLRPGVYRARVFDDCGVLQKGELKERLAIIQIETEVTEAGDYLIRLPVVSPENEGFDNAYLPAVEATAFYTMMTQILYDCRWNSGLNRSIKIDYVPEKSRLNAGPKRSVNYASSGIGVIFSNVLQDALARALFVSGRLQDVAAPATGINGTGLGGTNQYGRIAVQSLTSSGAATGGGALLDHDGIDSAVSALFNPWTYIPDVEADELGLPIVELARYHRPDSGGFGKFRGGTGVNHVVMIHNSPSMGLTKYGTGVKVAENQGLFGGYPGPCSFFDIMRETNVYEAIASGAPLPFTSEAVPQLLKVNGEHYTGHTSCTERALKSGDFATSSSHGGGGGVGDPIERAPELIVKDIRDKVATLEVAQGVYAVAIDPQTLEVDDEATEKLRTARRKERMAQGVPGMKYLKQLVRAREEKKLPQVVLDFLEETRKFSPTFERELSREKEIVSGMPKRPGKVRLGEKIVSLTPYVDIRADDKGRKWAVCSQCGFVYCEADDNFKLHCLIYDRDPAYFHPGRLAYDKDWCVFREFYCPSCAAQVEVEAAPPGTPILWNYELKL